VPTLPLTRPTDKKKSQAEVKKKAEVMNWMQVVLKQLKDEYQRIEHQVTTATDQ
jgi:hypothetical protein